MTTTSTSTRRAPRVGESAPRPDGIPKVQGRFAFGSDLWAEGMLWGATVRAPLPYGRIRTIDLAEAWRIPGVRAIVTAEDVPGLLEYGLEHRDQPVFARDVVRYTGEPVAAVAADHPDTARRAAAAIRVEYEPLRPLTDPEEALDVPAIHPDGNLFRHVRIRHGDADARGAVVVDGFYEVGMQDQAFLGPEAGLAVPDDDGLGVELYISTQWLHVDRNQVADCLALPLERVRLTLAGVGGAFGAREDVSLQVHVCLLALRTGRPVKMMYGREESFFGHVHRHPARMWYRHHADRDGRLVKIEARILLDGGAYTSSSRAVIANASCFAAGPYRLPNAVIDGYAVRTNNPPCGAMRGFGAVQNCFAHEAQMDKLAAALAIDPVELRLRNALEPGDTLVTGQVLRGAAPVAEVIRRCAATPLPADDGADDYLARPGGAGRTAGPGDVRRGVGFAVGFKNLLFSEGFDDYSTARVRVEDGVVTVHCACAEVGQGFVTLAQQIAREVLGLDDVVLAPADTAVGSAGSTSASRQTWMSGGAVARACQDVLAAVAAQVASDAGVDPATLELVDDRIASSDGTVDVPIRDAVAGRVFEATHEYHHDPTQPLDENGQGNAHVSFAFAAHRAVVDVDAELGLIRVVEIATAQDVGRVLNPLQAVGQIEGGIAQGVGLAVMEEMIIADGTILNPSFTDYLMPTALDMPVVTISALIEEPEPGAPFGAKGIGEAPTVSSTAAVAAAVRVATGLELARVPIRPQDIALAGAEPGRAVVVSRVVLRGARWPGDVAIDGSRIEAVGTVEARPDDEIVDCSGTIITPGLINTHHHLFQWMTRGRAIGCDLFAWLTTLYPVWGRLEVEDVRVAARVGLAELVSSGCTSVFDHHYLVPHGDDTVFDAIVDAAREVGARLFLSRGSMDLSQKDGGLPPDHVVEGIDQILASTESVIDRHHDGDMVTVVVAPCSPFSVSPELMLASAELARARGLRLHTHLAETLEEQADSIARFGHRPTELLDTWGWIAPDVWVAHGIHFDDAEIARLGAAGTGVAHCPSSNARLGAGMCRVTDLTAAGTAVGLGVDGAASNEVGLLFGEMRQALYTARQRAVRADVFSPRDALAIATEGGARCVGRDDLGRLTPGARADIAVFGGADLVDMPDPIAGLVLGPDRRATHVLVDGRFIVRDGEVLGIDLQAAHRELGSRAARLWD